MKKSDDNYYFAEEKSNRFGKLKLLLMFASAIKQKILLTIENCLDGDKRICTLEVKNCNSTKGSAKILIFIPIKIL